MVIWNIHRTALSKCIPRQLTHQHPHPLLSFSSSCIDTDQHIPYIRGITYCPGDTLQMYLRLMIYHSKGSTKTISKPDTLTSDFKKFPSNLFDLWKCVQVHREWFQIYHILVRIINDFQFVNLMLPCRRSSAESPKADFGVAVCSEAWLLYQNIATYMTYISLIFHSCRAFPITFISLSSRTNATHIFQKWLLNTAAATAYVVAWLIFWS